MKYESKVEEGILFITLQGDLIEEFRGHRLLEIVNEQVQNQVLLGAIDLSDVRYINSSGIGLLVSVLTKFRNRGGELVIINPSEHSKKLLIATKLYAIFTIADSPESAAALLHSVQLDPVAESEETTELT